MRTAIVFAAVLLAVIAAGCVPPTYGLFRSARLQHAPDLGCVGEVLERTGATAIRFYADERPLDWRGLAQLSGDPAFIYEAPGGTYSLQLYLDRDGRADFLHVGWAERKTPAATLRSLRAHLDRVDLALQEECDLAGLVAAIEEECRGVNCSEL